MEYSSYLMANKTLEQLDKEEKAAKTRIVRRAGTGQYIFETGDFFGAERDPGFIVVAADRPYLSVEEPRLPHDLIGGLATTHRPHHAYYPFGKLGRRLSESSKPEEPKANRESESEPTMTDARSDNFERALQAIEDRIDRRIDRMERSESARADAYRREQEARDRLYTERFEATNRRIEDREQIIDTKLSAMSSSLAAITEKVSGFERKLEETVDQVKSDNRDNSRHLSQLLLAAVLGLLAVNGTMIFGAKTFFDSGREAAAIQSSIEQLKRSIEARPLALPPANSDTTNASSPSPD